MKNRSRFVILDASSMVFRALHQRGPALVSPSGEPTAATYMFCRMLFQLIQDLQPEYLAAALDVPRRDTFRRGLYHGYKRNRDGKPPACPDSQVQIDRCIEILKTSGMECIKVPTFEADDVIATLVTACGSDEVECVVVTRDKDLHQVVGPNCRLLDHQTHDWTDEAAVEARWKLPPCRVIEAQTLMGDPGDGVPGVKGIGPKVAAHLLETYESIEDLMAHLDDLKPGVRKALKNADLDLCRKLVELRTDVPITSTAKDLAFDGFNMKALRPLFTELGFHQWV